MADFVEYPLPKCQEQCRGTAWRLYKKLISLKSFPVEIMKTTEVRNLIFDHIPHVDKIRVGDVVLCEKPSASSSPAKEKAFRDVPSLCIYLRSRERFEYGPRRRALACEVLDDILRTGYPAIPEVPSRATSVDSIKLVPDETADRVPSERKSRPRHRSRIPVRKSTSNEDKKFKVISKRRQKSKIPILATSAVLPQDANRPKTLEQQRESRPLHRASPLTEETKAYRHRSRVPVRAVPNTVESKPTSLSITGPDTLVIHSQLPPIVAPQAPGSAEHQQSTQNSTQDSDRKLKLPALRNVGCPGTDKCSANASSLSSHNASKSANKAKTNMLPSARNVPKSATGTQHSTLPPVRMSSRSATKGKDYELPPEQPNRQAPFQAGSNNLPPLKRSHGRSQRNPQNSATSPATQGNENQQAAARANRQTPIQTETKDLPPLRRARDQSPPSHKNPVTSAATRGNENKQPAVRPSRLAPTQSEDNALPPLRRPRGQSPPSPKNSTTSAATQGNYNKLPAVRPNRQTSAQTETNDLPPLRRARGQSPPRNNNTVRSATTQGKENKLPPAHSSRLTPTHTDTNDLPPLSKLRGQSQQGPKNSTTSSSRLQLSLPSIYDSDKKQTHTKSGSGGLPPLHRASGQSPPSPKNSATSTSSSSSSSRLQSSLPLIHDPVKKQPQVVEKRPAPAQATISALPPIITSRTSPCHQNSTPVKAKSAKSKPVKSAKKNAPSLPKVLWRY